MATRPVAPRVRVDFQNADAAGRIRLNTRGCTDDIRRLGLELCEGLVLTLVDGELSTKGTVTCSDSERAYVAVINWKVLQAEGFRGY